MMLARCMIKPNQKSKKLVIKRLVRDGVVAEAEQDISELFNDFFSNVGKNIDESLPVSQVGFKPF